MTISHDDPRWVETTHIEATGALAQAWYIRNTGQLRVETGINPRARTATPPEHVTTYEPGKLRTIRYPTQSSQLTSREVPHGASSAIVFPDVSQYNGALNLADYPALLARATISTATDTHYTANRSAAASAARIFGAYAFINAGSLGVSASAQADYAYNVIGTMPTMLDLEPNRGACASLAEGITWINRFRSHGGVVHLCYLPRWSWSGNMGSPSLTPLTSMGVQVVSSNYTTYSDTGPGWEPYGGVTPIQWQYTDNLAGVGADGNAYKGTAAQYAQLITGGSDMANMWTDASQVLPDGEVPYAYLVRVLEKNILANVNATLAAVKTPAPITLTDAQIAQIADQVSATLGASIGDIAARLKAAGAALDA